jgi:hypothetical protein
MTEGESGSRHGNVTLNVRKPNQTNGQQMAASSDSAKLRSAGQPLAFAFGPLLCLIDREDELAFHGSR